VTQTAAEDIQMHIFTVTVQMRGGTFLLWGWIGLFLSDHWLDGLARNIT
jgi:hypothetical protein